VTPVVLSLVTALLGILGFGQDPAPNAFRSRDRARRLECARTVGDVAEKELVGQVSAAKPSGVTDPEALVCRERLLRPGLREPRDEAVLRDLEARVSAVASQVASVRADLADRTWLVETFYPDPAVGTKISFALKSALMRQSLQVSDRLPLLSATDIEIVTRLPPSRSYAVACRRWHETGQLRDDDVLLAQITRDLRETNLHTGLCIDGRWSWLR